MSNPGTQDPNSPQSHDQWIRKVGLIVSGGGEGLDLSELRVQFQVRQSDFETPNNAVIRVFNPSANTAQRIRKEFTEVTLQAGYQNGAYGIIFQGTIKQVLSGRNSQTETYLDIFAGDSDALYNFGMANQSIAAGTDPKAQIALLSKQMGAQVGDVTFNTGLQANIRGKTMYGMARNMIRNLARSGGATWSLQNGKVTVIPLTGYAKGEAVVINSQTGMVGLPQQTEEGIRVTCLLNPKIVIGTQVQIDQSAVQRAGLNQFSGQIQQAAFFNADQTQVAQLLQNNFPPVTNDGFYYVMVAEHEGDTRDNDYYTTLTCLSVNKTVPAGQSVKAAG